MIDLNVSGGIAISSCIIVGLSLYYVFKTNQMITNEKNLSDDLHQQLLDARQCNVTLEPISRNHYGPGICDTTSIPNIEIHSQNMTGFVSDVSPAQGVYRLYFKGLHDGFYSLDITTPVLTPEFVSAASEIFSQVSSPAVSVVGCCFGC